MIKNLMKSNESLPIGLDIIRVFSGGIILWFGMEIFDEEQMMGYTEWLTKVDMPAAQTMAYIGKISELVFGIFLLLGFLTRVSAIPLIATMFVVNFIMLDGDLWSQSFYLLMIFAVFLFVGGGIISIDHLITGISNNA